MALVVKVNGVIVHTQKDSLTMSDQLGSRSTCSFALRGLAGGLPSVQRGQLVEIYDDVLTETIRRSQDMMLNYPFGIQGNADWTQYAGKLTASWPLTNLSIGTVELVVTLIDENPLVPDLGGELLNIDTDYGNYFVLKITDKVAGKRYFKATAYTTKPTFPYTSIEINITGTTEIEDLKSYRVAVVWKPYIVTGCQMELFIDGVSEGIGTSIYKMETSFGGTTKNLTIWGNGAHTPINIYRSDIRIWHKERLAAELLATAKSRLIGADLVDADLECYLRLDEGTGVDCNDSGPAGNDGLLEETVVWGGGSKMIWHHSPDAWLPPDPSLVTCADNIETLRYFTGFVKGAPKDQMANGVAQRSVSCVDFSSVCDRVLVNHTFTSPRSSKYLAQWLVENHLAEYYIGFRCIPSDGAYIANQDWRRKAVSQCLEKIKTTSDWVWYIDAYKELRFHPRGYRAAPFDITSGANYMVGSLRSKEDTDQYYNHIFGRFQYDDGYGTSQTLVIELQDDAEIAARAAIEGGTGEYQLFYDITDASSPEEAIDAVQGKLNESVTMGETVTYSTQRTGLRAGMSQTITVPELGIDDTFLISTVKTSFQGGIAHYDITATTWHKSKELHGLLGAVLDSKTNWQSETWFEGAGALSAKTEGMVLGDTAIMSSGTGALILGTGELDYSEVG